MKKVGLALGGGSAHGIAHIGVLQVLLENNIPIDYVAGCSAGAIVGGIYCTGGDMYMTGKLASAMEVSSFIDITLPRTGFVKGLKAEQLVDMLTKGKNIEECQTPFCSVACDLISGDCVTIKSGRVSRACHASFAIPGVFEPVEINGMQLIDGGAMTRVPIEQARQMGADYIIAVDVGYKGGGHPRAKRVTDIIMAAFDMCDWQVVEGMYNKADCVLSPDLRDIPMNSLEKAEETVAIGRECALSAIEKIKRDIM